LPVDIEQGGRWSITSPSPADLFALVCKNCGIALQGGDEAALFLCAECGRAFEPGDQGLTELIPTTATVTTELAIGAPVRYLAFWRLCVSISASPGSAWERIRRATTESSPRLYVPAFSLSRPVVQQLGISLTEAQPALEATAKFGEDAPRRPLLVEVGSAKSDAAPAADEDHGVDDLYDPRGPNNAGPGFGSFSPVVIGREDVSALAHFVYLAVESHEVNELRSVDYELEITGEELVFIPAVWDPRYIHESNWRLLLREFDGLVA